MMIYQQQSEVLDGRLIRYEMLLISRGYIGRTGGRGEESRRT